METKKNLMDKQKSINWQITLKVFIIGVIAIVLLVPKFMILGLIQERQKTAENTSKEVMQQWSNSQTLRGPVLSIPYIEKTFNKDRHEISEKINELYILPKKLLINGEIFPEKRNKSIYETVVYKSELDISGSFELSGPEALNISNTDILWEKAKILVAVSDLRGINNRILFEWNNSSHSFSAGMENKLIGSTGISLPLTQLTTNDFPAKFRFTINLKGSESLKFAPLGEITNVVVESSWDDPGFTGNFLPEKHDINNDGFIASWSVLNFNRNFPQQWKNEDYHVTGSDFGVTLVSMAGNYQKNSRSAKYAILVILFIFLSFFLNEVITKQKIHPFQYILVGFSVLVFYLLLLSISEQLGFNLAYLLSAVSVIIMVLFYSRTFLKSWKDSWIQLAILTFSFGFIFVLMQLETLALLTGSIGLFVVLALTMYFTRKINWYNE